MHSVNAAFDVVAMPQDKHAVLPRPGWYFACVHDTQLPTSSAPNIVPYFPAVQAVHGAEPTVGLYVPAVRGHRGRSRQHTAS
jgi:hypothetical protein